MSKGGPQHPDLLHAAKRVCSNCNGTVFQVELTTSNAGAGEGIWFLCHCGHCELITFEGMGATQNYSV